MTDNTDGGWWKTGREDDEWEQWTDGEHFGNFPKANERDEREAVRELIESVEFAPTDSVNENDVAFLELAKILGQPVKAKLVDALKK
jgi:hypothetical protein